MTDVAIGGRLTAGSATETLSGKIPLRCDPDAAMFRERTSAMGVRREKAALSSGCKPRPATAPAGSNRSSHGGNEVAEAFD
jgi:hypothetical protein